MTSGIYLLVVMEAAQINSNIANLASLPASGPSEHGDAPWWPLAVLPAGLDAALHHLMPDASFRGPLEAHNRCSITAC